MKITPQTNIQTARAFEHEPVVKVDVARDKVLRNGDDWQVKAMESGSMNTQVLCRRTVIFPWRVNIT